MDGLKREMKEDRDDGFRNVSYGGSYGASSQLTRLQKSRDRGSLSDRISAFDRPAHNGIRPQMAVLGDRVLVEKILLQLPAAIVLGSRTVCRQFRDVVATSLKIQEELWFQHQEHGPLSWMARDLNFDSSDTVLSMGNEETLSYVEVKLNSMLSVVDATACIKSGRPMQLTKDRLFKIEAPCRIRGTQLWQYTQLTTPPTTEATAVLFWQICPGVYGYSKRTVTQSDGLRFADVHGAALFNKDMLLGDYDWYLESAHHREKAVRQRGRTARPFIDYKHMLIDVLKGLEDKYHCATQLRGASYITVEELAQ